MKNIIRSIFTILGLAVFASSTFASHLEGHLLFTAKMTGDQEVPAVVTDAVGVGSFSLNEDRDELCINIAVNNLSGPITAAHIHSGAVGVNGDPVVNVSTGITGNQIMYSVSGAELTTELIAMLINGEVYLNIHTDANPGGEIRGQITLETDWSFVADASGSEEVPMVITDAQGLGVFTLSKNQSMINYQFIADGLSGVITGAHLHIAAAGETGDVEENLTMDIMGNSIVGNFVPSELLLEKLMSNEVYLNVHTDENPGGEIRAQLSMKAFAFDAWLNGEQEVPAVMTDAMGVASLSISATLDTLWYDVMASGLSDEITGAHIHEAVAGESGDVIIGLTDDIAGNRIQGMITGADLTADMINTLLHGEGYLNLHTDLNPGGEIRGQVYRLAREGYTSLVNAEQEVTASTSTGYGSGIVSIDRNQSNVHFMYVVGNLEGPVTAAHFHNAAADVDGDVIFNLSSFFTGGATEDAAFGYWTNEDMDSPFSATQSLMFRNEAVYVNLHSDLNPSGEIRGQVDRGMGCYDAPTLGLENIDLENVISVYPNPFTNSLNINLNQSVETGSLEIRNMTGAIVYQETIGNQNSTMQIDLSNLERGLYVVYAMSEKEIVAVQKITKF
ncbi:CHRD domain-containing protein [Crocinitomix catalasitica]|uniref:CHRD domain-containing protein n=1 Tax=Crocinitomix catalasitica TaxID=184607 RepID=UPI000486E1BE|nr:CHRD domain-containing protein [Crocinitomix catalasitica]